MPISLTEDLVAKVHRVRPDSGPANGCADIPENELQEWCDRLFAQRPQGPLWVFAYGSLIWKPTFVADEQRVAVARGWHRAFVWRLARWRGTPEQPGLMMVLDRGGSCRGIAYRIAEANVRAAVVDLLDREMTAKPSANVPRWIRVQTSEHNIWALAFAIDRNAPSYAGRLDDDTVARTLATAGGHLGSCAEYLHQTVVHLEANCIRDATLWRLQSKVADIIRALPDDRETIQTHASSAVGEVEP